MDCFGTYFTHVQSCNSWFKVLRNGLPALRPSTPPTCIDVYRRRETSRDMDKIYIRRETSRDIDKIYRRRRRRPGLRPSASYMYRRLSTSRDIENRETSIKSIDVIVVVVALVCAHPPPIVHVSMSIDVARHRETLIKSIDVARHRETSIKFIDVARHR